MRLCVSTTEGTGELASAVIWPCESDIYTSGDDCCVRKWDPQGRNMGKVHEASNSITCLHSTSALVGRQQSNSADVLAVGCTDGILKLVQSNGKPEKTTEAHSGAVLCVRWSPDGNAIATSGEDGHVKIWSRTGMLRSTLLEAEDPVHCLAWGGSDASQLLICVGSSVSIRSLQGVASGASAGSISSAAPGRASASTSNTGSAMQASWKAHDGYVLKADWNPITGLIVTGGEDCRYKVWDTFGRLLFSSMPWEYAITSLCWRADGSAFAVGSFNSLALCDQHGWVYSQVSMRGSRVSCIHEYSDCDHSHYGAVVSHLLSSARGAVAAVHAMAQARHTAGSLLDMCWSPDGTRIAAAGSNGSLAVASVLEMLVEDGTSAAVLMEPNTVGVTDMVTEGFERLEFKNAVVQMSIGFGHLVVCTATHCHVYATTTNLHTPSMFDLKEQPQLVLQCHRNFALVDAAAGIQVYTYDGRQVCLCRPQGLNPCGISKHLVSLSNDTLAVAAGTSVRFYETAQGRSVGDVFSHSLDIQAVCLSQAGVATDRLLALLDSNGDLYLMRQLSAGASGPRQVIAPSAPATNKMGIAGGVITASGLAPIGAGQQQPDLQRQKRLVKFATNVPSAPAWHASAPILAAVVDGHLVVWYHPGAVFLDHQLMQASRCVISTDSVGPGASLETFGHSTIVIRQRNGAKAMACMAQQPVLLHDLVRQGKWDKAIRLARFSHDVALWACLAALAMAAGELYAAEAAFAAIDAVDKLQYVQHLKRLCKTGAAATAVAGNPLVAAELALYAGRVEDAEALLLQAGLVYRAVKLHVRLHHWQRALDIAVKRQQHLDTVLMYRQRYLEKMGQSEHLPDFKTKMEGVQLDVAAIKDAVKQDKAREIQLQASAQAQQVR